MDPEKIFRQNRNAAFRRRLGKIRRENFVVMIDESNRNISKCNRCGDLMIKEWEGNRICDNCITKAHIRSLADTIERLADTRGGTHD